MILDKIYNALTTAFNLCRLKLNHRHNVKYGRDIRLCGRISFKISPYGRLHLGNSSVITGGSFRNPLGCLRGSCIKIDRDAIVSIGNYTAASDVSIRAREKIIIGKYVTIGAETIINDSNSHCLDYRERRKEHSAGLDWQALPIKKAPIIIGDDVFIGARCIIGKGVTIGARSVIAAGSVVVKNIPEDEIWGGNPAVFIKKIIYEKNKQ